VHRVGRLIRNLDDVLSSKALHAEASGSSLLESLFLPAGLRKRGPATEAVEPTRVRLFSERSTPVMPQGPLPCAAYRISIIGDLGCDLGCV
jgi:hypothetical protein